MAQTPARIEHDHGPPALFEEYSLDTWQLRFLNAFAETGMITAASKKARISHAYHYRWMKNNDYSMAYKDAEAIFVNSEAEGAVVQRGIFGYKKQLSYKGKLTGDETTEFSDVMAQAYMKAHDPRYRDGQTIAVGPAKIAIEIINAAGDLQRNSVASTGIEVAVQIPEIAEEIQAPQVRLPPDLPPQKQAPPLRPGRK